MISDTEFVNGIQFMMEKSIMTMADSENIMKMQSTEITQGMSEKAKEMIMKEAAKTSTSSSEEMEDAGPVTTHMGEFRGLQGHQGEGIAKIISVDEQNFLRFENFKVTNGPDLFVYIAPDGDVSQGLLLERLKGSSGNQNYELPEDTDLAVYNTAVVYCKLFGVYFAEAPLN